MVEPVPNIITVCGFEVPVTYRGVIIQCRRCLREGHLKAGCTTPFCDRCKSFGHEGNGCAAPCLKCKAPGHHWRDCSVRNYAFAATRDFTEPAPAETVQGGVDSTAAPSVGDPESSACLITLPVPIRPGNSSTNSSTPDALQSQPMHNDGTNMELKDAVEKSFTSMIETDTSSESKIIEPPRTSYQHTAPGTPANSMQAAAGELQRSALDDICEEEIGTTLEVANGLNQPLTSGTEGATVLGRPGGDGVLHEPAWQRIVTRSSKRRQTLTPARLPDPKRGSANPD